ncbi:MAG: hypothetical protein EBZ14_08045 [Gammaproteobacteria bacterium]|jgi:hypothetical protein|nr:hypothetical protein [Gammaproteobacteria bacterium]NDA15186.1 hypothetical protein [Gammaproteobacteria bacterium]
MAPGLGGMLEEQSTITIDMDHTKTNDELASLKAENDQLKRQILLYQKQYKRSWVMFLISLVLFAVLFLGR